MLSFFFWIFSIKIAIIFKKQITFRMTSVFVEYISWIVTIENKADP